MKFILLSCFLILSKNIIPHAADTTVIEHFQKTSPIVGKSNAEAEMAYFTQIFSFVNKNYEFGSSMLNFLKKYVEMRQGNEVNLNQHWIENNETESSKNYKYRSSFCYNYLLDNTLQASGIDYNPDPQNVIEIELDITFHYYKKSTIKCRVLQCPVKVKMQHTLLFFMKYKNIHNSVDSSYFVLASVSELHESPLYVLMYTTRRVTKKGYREKNRKFVPLSSLEEEQYPVEEEQYPYEDRFGPVDFRKLLKAPNESSSAENSPVVLFGQSAERVFITATSFYFINLTISPRNWMVDYFIQLVENMRQENQLQFTNEISKLDTNTSKFKTCKDHMKHNAALRLRNINPDIKQMEDGQGMEIASKMTTFPQTQLPDFEFKSSMLACPALFGEKKESRIVYFQFVLILTKFNEFSNWVFALLESSEKEETVYPVTLSQTKSAHDHLKLEHMNEHEIPTIYDDHNTDQSTKGNTSSAGIST